MAKQIQQSKHPRKTAGSGLGPEPSARSRSPEIRSRSRVDTSTSGVCLSPQAPLVFPQKRDFKKLGTADHASRGSIGTEGGRRGALRRVLTRRALGHWQTSPALASKPRGARYFMDRGTTRWNSRAPARQGPSPEERHPVYPQRFNWFESTPKNAPRLPIQTNNHTN